MRSSSLPHEEAAGGPWTHRCGDDVGCIRRPGALVDAGAAAWTVRLGPGSLRTDHEVEDGMTAVVLDAPAAVVLGHLPMARIALSRLVHRDAERPSGEARGPS
jgi:hypothetical protein